jgi:hypothetical protein
VHEQGGGLLQATHEGAQVSKFDKTKAEKLFAEHVKPTRQSQYGGDVYHVGNSGPLYYVITPEMLRFLRVALSVASTSPGASFPAAYTAAEYVLFNLDGGWPPLIKWDREVQTPAWRIAADEAHDQGLDFAGILDAIERELADDAYELDKGR